MRASAPEGHGTAATSGRVLRLVVRNHAGVMSHVCGLFARRGFNVESIVCVPAADGTRSCILLALSDDVPLEQLVRHLRKLEDVLNVQPAPEAGATLTALAGALR